VRLTRVNEEFKEEYWKKQKKNEEIFKNRVEFFSFLIEKKTKKKTNRKVK